MKEYQDLFRQGLLFCEPTAAKNQAGDFHPHKKESFPSPGFPSQDFTSIAFHLFMSWLKNRTPGQIADWRWEP